MSVTDRRYLVALLTTGAVAVGAVLLLLVTARQWFTPAVEAVGALSGLAFLVLGIRWSFGVLGDVYGD